MTKDELELGYRTSVIAKKDYIVLSAVIRLENGRKEEIKAVMDDLKEKKNYKAASWNIRVQEVHSNARRIFRGKADTGCRTSWISGRRSAGV